jgi:hypothetical protein
VAYFDADRTVKVAQRTAGGPWSYRSLDSTFGGWDGHNELKLYVDENFDIHLSGNQHGSPLNYWRSNGLDIASLTRQLMVGATEESLVTYPRFFRTPQGQLLFGYRTGHAGDGAWLYYAYDPALKTWSRKLTCSSQVTTCALFANW